MNDRVNGFLTIDADCVNTTFIICINGRVICRIQEVSDG